MILQQRDSSARTYQRDASHTESLIVLKTVSSKKPHEGRYEIMNTVDAFSTRKNSGSSGEGTE